VPGNCLLNLVRHANPQTVQIDLVRAQSNMTVQVAMAQEHQIGFLKTNNPEVLENVISLLVELLAVQFNVKDNFSGIQIVDCTLSIIEKFWYLRPEEVMYCFKQGKLGKYGPVYNKLDTPTIMTWLHKYDTEERMHQIEALRDQYKKAETGPQINIIEAYKDELKHQQENNGVPSLVNQSRENKQKDFEKRRGEVSFQQYQEEYFKKKKQSQPQHEDEPSNEI
jgi:hypothetical protein